MLKFHKPRFSRRIDENGVYELRNMGVCSYMLPNNSPIRLPLMDALLSSQHLYTILVDLSLQSNHNRNSLIMSNLNHCRGLSEFKIAELIELLEEWSPDRDDFSGSVCDQLTEDVQHVKKSDCQAIIDTRPTVFLTISDQYDHDVQKALLNLVNQLEKVLEGERGYASDRRDCKGYSSHPNYSMDLGTQKQNLTHTVTFTICESARELRPLTPQDIRKNQHLNTASIPII